MNDDVRPHGVNGRCIPIEQGDGVLAHGIIICIFEILLRIAGDIDDGIIFGLRSIEFSHEIDKWDLQIRARLEYE